MERLREFLVKVFAPGNAVIVIVDAIAVPLTVVALMFLPATHPVSFLAYLVSSYALAISIVGVTRLVKHVRWLLVNDRIGVVVWANRQLHRNPYIARYLDSRDLRNEVSVYTSMVMNTFYAVYNGVLGVLQSSQWLASIGFYYLALCAMRVSLARSIQVQHKTEDVVQRRIHEYRGYRLAGILMLVLNLAIAGMSVQMVWQNRSSQYTTVNAIISATFTFYSFISALAGFVSSRKYDNATLSAAKDIGFSGAIMSMFTLQAAMLNTFTDEGADPLTRQRANGLTAIVVLASVTAIAVWMIVKGTVQLRRLREADPQDSGEEEQRTAG